MKDLYKKIENNPGLDSYLYTVIEGENVGEKLFIADNKPIWHNSSFLLEHSNECHDTITKIDNQRIYKEKIGHQSHMVICGAGHVSISIIELAKKIGFTVTVLEDRPYFANNARKAGADEVICKPFAEAMDNIQSNTDTYFVIVTRGHSYDTVCLKAALKKPHAYIGMMGSRRRVHMVKKQLIESGKFTKDEVDAIYSPIGLFIKAETPDEIAVSIIAEIIQVKATLKSINGFGSHILRHITDSEENEKIALATIVSRKGSAPRQVGTKMLIFKNGTTVGTIGGGCVEGEVMSQSTLMLQNNDRNSLLLTVDMTDDEASEEGMVCGGIIEVFIEII